MPLPGNWTTVTVTHQHTAVGGVPMRGTVTWKSSDPVTDPSAGVTVPPSSHRVELDGAGGWSVTVPVVDDPDTVPTGWHYVVTLDLVEPSGRRVLSTHLVQVTAAMVPVEPGASVDWSELVEVSPVGEVSPYLRGVDLGTVVETPAGAQAKASAAQVAAIAAVAGTGPLRAVDGRNYRMVLGVIRNNGSGSGYWQALDDPNHRPHNIDSVTTDTSTIVVNFASLGGTRVVSLVVFPDETLAAAGIMAGASVTAAAATITLSRPAALADYVFYNGSAWVSQNGVYTGLSFAAGVLSLTHPSMEDPSNPFVTHYGVSVTGRGSALVPLISTDSGGVSSTALKVSWFDWAGTLQTAASTSMKAFITRSAPKAQTVNPQTVDTTKYPSSNLWIIGVVEV